MTTCSPACSEMHTFEPPCEQAIAGRVSSCDHGASYGNGDGTRTCILTGCGVTFPAYGWDQSCCPPCAPGAPHGQHEYDDDKPFEDDGIRAYFRSLGDKSQTGDPCVWCDHNKCCCCPPPRPIKETVDA